MSFRMIAIPSKLKQVNSWRWSGALIFDWVIIGLAMAGAIHAQHWVAWVAAVIVIGNFQHALGILGHDAAHYLGFRNRFINDLVSNCFITWPIGWSVEGYRGWHNKHHGHTGSPKDPELAVKRMTAPAWDLPLRFRRLMLEVLIDLCGRGFFSLIASAVVLFPPPKGWRRVGPVLWPLMISCVLVSMGYWEVVALWFLAAGTSFAAFMRMRMWIEHVGTNDTHRVELNFLEALILAPHNTWYHWEHHHYPFVPYFQLAKVRKLDTSVRVISLRELWGSLFNASSLPSGQVPKVLSPAKKAPRVTRRVLVSASSD